jgi:hypothetical protein
MKIKLDQELVRAYATDEGNRSMRKAGRKAWNEDDYNVAARTYNELLEKILNPELKYLLTPQNP